MPGGPGLLPAPKLILSDVFGVVWPYHVAPWPTPVTHSVGFLCRIRNDRPRLNFTVAFFSHNNVTNCQEFSYITLPTLFSFAI